MTNQWFYARNNQQAGPIMWEQLQQLAAGGGLMGSDMVWTEGMGNWVAAATVPGLFPAAPGGVGPTMPYPAAPMPPNAMPPGPTYGSPQGSGQQSGAPWLGYYAQLTPHYAGFWIRFLAVIIDGFVLVIPAFIMGAVVGLVLGSADIDPNAIVLVAQVFGLVLGMLYCSIMESCPTQATLGKMALGLKVTDLAGNRISFGHALGRWAGKIPSALILYIGFMMAGFTEKKQGLHDIMAGTLVVYK